MMNIRQIVEKYLRDNGYDGLAGCDSGCSLDDLMPCEEPREDCVAGRKVPCAKDGSDCENCTTNCPTTEGQWRVIPAEEEEKQP